MNDEVVSELIRIAEKNSADCPCENEFDAGFCSGQIILARYILKNCNINYNNPESENE